MKKRIPWMGNTNNELKYFLRIVWSLLRVLFVICGSGNLTFSKAIVVGHTLHRSFLYPSHGRVVVWFIADYSSMTIRSNRQLALRSVIELVFWASFFKYSSPKMYCRWSWRDEKNDKKSSPNNRTVHFIDIKSLFLCFVSMTLRTTTGFILL